MKYLSLFSGIGGFELGISRADPLAECIGFCEIDKYATQIYNKHFNHKGYGDITKLDPATIPDIDMLVGGFPCQAFSIAGKRKGFEDTRGTLFFDIARILQEKRPRLFLLENVKGLLSHKDGKTIATIITTLDGLGYDLQWQVLNSKDFGVPQNRERIYIVGSLRGTPRPQVFPFAECSNGNDWPARKEEATSLCLQTETGRRFDPTAQTLIADGSKLRRLTPLECERLQGFPDGWTQIGVERFGPAKSPAGSHESRTDIIKISDSQRYKCIGNAVTVNVIEAIMRELLNTPPKA